MKRMGQNTQELRSHSKKCNIHKIGVPEGEDRTEQKEYLK